MLGEGDRPAVDPQCELCGGELPDAGVLVYRDGEPETEGVREALLTVGNGYLATRGAAPEAVADGTRYPGTYVAGFYNRLISDVAGRHREDESVVNLPNWLPVTFRPAGADWFAPGVYQRLHEHQVLDLRTGVYRRECVVADRQQRRTRLRQRRLVSMASPHLAALESTVIPENWSGRLEIRSALDGDVVNANAAAFEDMAGRHLTDFETGTDGSEMIWLAAETTGLRLRVGLACRNRIVGRDPCRRPARHSIVDSMVVGEELALDVTVGEQVTLEKTVAIFTSRDRAISEPLTAARAEVTEAGPFNLLLQEHIAAWHRLHGRFRLEVKAEQKLQLPINVQTFHLLQSLSPHTAELDAGVPARGLHGEGYHGHVFWDELFVLPFLNLRLPELSRALLLYRYRRLAVARRQAAALGGAGAIFPWQSGSSGRDETPECWRNPLTSRWLPDYTRRQHHVNLAVAYNVWRYWEATADLPFLAQYGAELLMETARFWAGLATYDPAADRYDIRGVMGPDEFHDGYPDQPGQGLDNCAYINVMVAWVLARAADAHRILDQHHGVELWQHLQLTDAELGRWDHIGRRLRLSFLENGVLEQFEGYGSLAELNWDEYRARYGDISQLGAILQAEGDTSNRYKASKQADVLMLLYLFSAEELTALVGHLGYDFDPEKIPATVDYYLARTSHGSTLSRVAHAWVLARTDRGRSWRMLTEALSTDLADLNRGTTREGVHLGAIGGTLDILQRCYPGLDLRHDLLWLNPVLPEELDHLDLNIRYRGQLIIIGLDHSRITVHSLPSSAPPITIAIRDRFYELVPGTTMTASLDPDNDAPVSIQPQPAAPSGGGVGSGG
ncbi:MAG TPA: glycosyl hydrolase family 65 protein [Micromonosporaceae bacterium]|nr:glycosyl hydrolase family 65 protein [Micromonosporaceae bacterium]